MELDEDSRRQFKALGVDVSQLPPEAAQSQEHFNVWAPNWPVTRLFLACDTQWRAVGTFGGPVWLGLDYAAVETVQRRLGIETISWSDLQEMEHAALPILNERVER